MVLGKRICGIRLDEDDEVTEIVEDRYVHEG